MNRAQELSELMAESSRTGIPVERLREIRARVGASPPTAWKNPLVNTVSVGCGVGRGSSAADLARFTAPVPISGQSDLAGGQASRPLTEKQAAQRAVMAERQAVKAGKAEKIVAEGGVRRMGDYEWLVRSEPRSEPHLVRNEDGQRLECDCYDFTRYGGGIPCKHVLAVELTAAHSTLERAVMPGEAIHAAALRDKSQGETKDISPDGSQQTSTRAESGGSTETMAKSKGKTEKKGKKGGYERPECPRCSETSTRKSGHYTTTDGVQSQIWHCNACGFTWREGSARKGAAKKQRVADQEHEAKPLSKKGAKPVAATGGKVIIVAPPGTHKAGVGKTLPGKVGGASAVRPKT